MKQQSAKKSYCRLKLLASLIVVSITLLVACIMYFAYTKSILVETNLGSVVGISVNRLGKKVDCYYGVPYAEPPVGQLRFRKPVPKKRWKGVLKAIKPPPYCWQTEKFNSYNNYIKNFTESMIPEWSVYYDAYQSEDCLYLNIFAPSDNKFQANRTVMVWIHGGGFRSGSASWPLYDGSTLAAFADVIVVAINYRLNIFGFMSAGQTDLSGNYGLHDQVLALQWIKDNINFFGGNPNNTVIFGVYFAFLGPFKKYWSMNEIPKNFTKQTIKNVINNKIPEKYKTLAEIAIEMAFDDIKDDDKDPEKVFYRYIKIVGDAIFVCADYVLINEYSASNRSVYYYRFKQRPLYSPWSPKWARAAIHGDELPFVFGIPLIAPKFYTLKEIELSKTIMKMWTNFANTGIPSHNWPKYGENSEVYMTFNTSENKLEKGFPGYRCDEYYDKFITETRNFARNEKNITLD